MKTLLHNKLNQKRIYLATATYAFNNGYDREVPEYLEKAGRLTQEIDAALDEILTRKVVI